MKKYGISYETVKQTFIAHHFSFPAGQVNVDDKTLNVQADFKLGSVQDVEDMEILAQGPTGVVNVKLSEIADVSYSNKKEQVYTRLNEKPAVLVEMKAQPGSNTVEVVGKAKEELEKLDLPEGYIINQIIRYLQRSKNICRWDASRGIAGYVVCGYCDVLVFAEYKSNHCRRAFDSIINLGCDGDDEIFGLQFKHDDTGWDCRCCRPGN